MIEGYPESSMHGYYLKWGRNYEYAPHFLLDTKSEAAALKIQQHLTAQYPEAVAMSDLHATVLYCPPRTLFEAVQHMMHWSNPSIEDEVRFYADMVLSS